MTQSAAAGAPRPSAWRDKAAAERDALAEADAARAVADKAAREKAAVDQLLAEKAATWRRDGPRPRRPRSAAPAAICN